MIWTAALVVFIAQILCCIYVRNRFLKYLPTLSVAGFMAAAAIGGGWSAGLFVLLVGGASLLLGLLAIGLYHLAK